MQTAKAVSCICMQVTRLIPDAKGNKCNQEMELIEGTTHSHILRIPFITEKGVIGPWVSRFDIYPYLERYAQASTAHKLHRNEFLTMN